jgi:hypothetical protein
VPVPSPFTGIVGTPISGAEMSTIRNMFTKNARSEYGISVAAQGFCAFAYSVFAFGVVA